MELIRLWMVPVVLGLVVSVCGVGVAEVSGLAPDPKEPPARSVMPTQADPLPAAIESAPLPTRSPSVEPRVEPRVEPDRKPAASPTPKPGATESPTAAPTPAAVPTPSAVSEPGPVKVHRPRKPHKPRRPHPRPAPEIRHKPKPAPTPTLPGQLIDLANWKLTLPTGAPGSPTEIRQPQLGQFSAPDVFWVDAARKGVVFRALAGGVTTENSSYPRSELREMTAGGTTEAGWSNAAGMHVMTIVEAITAVPAVKPHVVAGQVHDTEDDVIMIRLEGTRLFVESDGNELALLDPNYQLGTKFEVRILAYENHLHVHYNGEAKLIVPRTVEGAYFKAGCYTQSNPSRGDNPESFGEVVIYALTVQHS